MRSRPNRSWQWILVVGVLAILGVGVVRAWDDSRQVSSGDGWRLLGRQRAVGERNRVDVIADQATLEAAWKGLLLHTDPPTVDFGRSIVAWLTPAGTIACPTRLDRIRFDAGQHLVDGLFSLGLSIGCRSPSVNDTFLVAIDRDRLPAAPYRMRILGPDPGDLVNGELDLGE